LVRGSFWSLAGSMASRALALVSAIVAARILGKASYGELGIIQSTVGMFGTLAGFGMGTTATKYVAEFRLRDPMRAGRIIALSSVVSWSMSCLLAIGLALSAPWLSQHTLAAPALSGCLRLSALLLLLSAVSGAQNGVLSGFEAFKRMAWVNSLAGIINCLSVMLGALWFGLSGILWGMILGQAAVCILNHYAIKKVATVHKIPLTHVHWSSEAGVLWHFTVPAVLGGLIMTPIGWACAAMLVRRSHGYEEMGAFNAANQWFSAVMWLPYMLGGVLLPMLSERLAAEKARSIKLLVASIKINAAIVFPLVLAGSLLSPYIMAACGKEFRGEWPTMVITLISAGFFALQMPIGEVIAASGRMWVGFSLNLVWGLVYLFVTWTLLKWGSVGLASARMLAYLVQGILAFIYAWVAIYRTRETNGHKTLEE
jgi:O-antigen/teichoic acid export membrane protein